MLVSLSWLRELYDLNRPVAEVAEVLTARGLTVDSVSETGDDTIFDIDVPANRPDCLGHLGIARELRAALGGELAPPPSLPAGDGVPVTDAAEVFIDNPDECRRFTATLIRGVKIGPSPRHVVRRLESCGLRSVSNVVDVSNLVMLELGQPIHTYDLERVEQATLRVRRASDGEPLTTLDGIDRRLDEDALAIADGGRAVGLAGVIGGANTEIHSGTSDVLIESANFIPPTVRSMARRLGIKTDASHRFERGVDPELPPVAQARALQLIQELGGGIPAPGILDLYPGRKDPARVVLRTGRVGVLLGYQPDREEIEGALRALELAPEAVEDDSVEVTVPSWRYDLEEEPDIVEEVARHLGYDRIPSSLPRHGIPPVEPDRAQQLEEHARELLSHFGFEEAINYAMIGENEDAAFVGKETPDAAALENPISTTNAWLRRSMIPGLIRSVDFNVRRGARDVRLFEIGSVFLPRAGGFPDEPQRVALAWTGAPRPRHWSGSTGEAEFHHLAGLVDTLLASLGTREHALPEPADLAGLHPGRSASWTASSGDVVAWGGELHPGLCRRLDLSVTVLVAEIDLAALQRSTTAVRQHEALPRVPSATRDLSLVIGAGTRYREVEDVLEGIESPAPASFEVVDRYTGDPLPDDEASVTVRVMLQPLERSLTDPEIESYRLRLIEALDARLGVKIRSGD
ncbi:MAG: phenylalanine--tRNA ligase subunit beta [Acidobacteriota bacterium]|nr:phenylalanine--tRNA ligase subunit beta [Acidobacteriota bacterium]